ncbi:MAG: hypothetical protein L6Q98_03075 [Anaerolineae bacterium]|nr:hypothetical protein [Anaerolineae bacterium]NUQ02423.1 hypothetical protein [Anaerolineae bacterium]
MGDFLRFLAIQDCDLTLIALESLFRRRDSQFSIRVEAAAPTNGELLHGSSVLADIEINRPGEQIFDEDITDLIEMLEGIDEAGDRVVARLGMVKIMVALQLTEEGHASFDLIDPLWDLLFETCDGLLQVDDEGYYDSEGVVLALD